MKILILSVTCGGGHNSCANAIKESVESFGEEAAVLDTLEYISPYLSSFNEFVYKQMVSFAGGISFSALYKLTTKSRRSDCEISPVRLIAKSVAPSIEKAIKNYGADAVICTHFYPAIMLDELRLQGRLDIPFAAVSTDYTIAPLWEEAGYADKFIIPSPELVKEALSKGFRKKQLLPLGIPVSSKFLIKADKKEARKKLGLDENKFTALIMGGGFGYGNFMPALKGIDMLDEKTQTVAVCGSNVRAYERLSAESFDKDVRIIGFTDSVSDYMDAADILITKPGGLTVTEALAKKLPIIVYHCIPGHEQRNAEFLCNNGCAMMSNEYQTVGHLVYKFIHSKRLRESMRSNIAATRKPNAAKDIALAAIELAKEKEN